MHIVFHVKTACPGGCPDRDAFIAETVSRLMRRETSHRFSCLTEGEAGAVEALFGAKDQAQLALRGPLSAYRKYRMRLPALLKALDATVLVSFSGVLAPAGSVPGCLVVPGGLATDPASSRFGRAATLAPLTALVASRLRALPGMTEERIYPVHAAAPEAFRPLDWEARERIKETYTHGREYFLSPDPLESEAQLVGLLKGFSVLKKRLRSSMVLVLTGPLKGSQAQLSGLLATYHFREDVLRVEAPDVAVRAGLTGAAYAMVTASEGTGYGCPIHEALACRVPVLAADGPGNLETAGEAALYYPGGDAEALGEKFCELYKYENLRARLIAASDAEAARYSWDRTADALWRAILAAGQAGK